MYPNSQYINENYMKTHPHHPTTSTIQETHHTHPEYTKGKVYKWDNPYGLSIPVIQFDRNCGKCHGTGAYTKRFSGEHLPCTRCYAREGYCKKCYGTGTDYRKYKPCTDCDMGKKMNKFKNSSSNINQKSLRWNL